MAPKYTITYFDVPGLGEPVRLALVMSGEEWEDKRLTYEEIVALKPTLPFGQVPILEFDGVVLCQSPAILRYVGRLAGLYPSDPLEAARADIAADAVTDNGFKMLPWMTEQDPAKKMELQNDIVQNFLPTWFGNLEKMLKAAGGEYFAGGKLSTGDLAIACRVKWYKDGSMDGIPATIMDDYPLLNALVDRVNSEPKIATYYESKQAAKK